MPISKPRPKMRIVNFIVMLGDTPVDGWTADEEREITVWVGKDA